MAKKVVAKLGIKRDSDRLYFIRDGAVWSSPRKGVRGRRTEVARFAPRGSMDYAKFIYFLDKAGNVVAADRKRKRKAAAKKKTRATKKTTKKTTKKRPAKRRARR